MLIDQQSIARLVYKPRVIAHFGCIAILLTYDLAALSTPGVAAMIGFSLVYPHLLYLASRRTTTSASKEIAWQYLDAFYGGVFCGYVHLAPLPVASILMILTLSHLILFGRGVCVRGWLFTGLGMATCLMVDGLHYLPPPNDWTNGVSALTLVAYGWIVSVIVFDQGRYAFRQQIQSQGHYDELKKATIRLGRYLSPQILQLVSQQSGPYMVRTARKRLTLFFSDIQGFTELTDMMEPEALAGLLNNYLDEMSRIALGYGGTIDKFIGDGLMIFFGDPISHGVQEDAERCVEMALAMRERLKELREQWENDGISQPLHIRIGIHTGFCTVGNFGCDARLEYTAVGSSVNLASRLESLADADDILISRETYLLVRDRASCDELGPIQVKGFKRPRDLYRVIAMKTRPDSLLVEDIPGLHISLKPGRVNLEQAVEVLGSMIRHLRLKQESSFPTTSANGLPPTKDPLI